MSHFEFENKCRGYIENGCSYGELSLMVETLAIMAFLGCPKVSALVELCSIRKQEIPFKFQPKFY